MSNNIDTSDQFLDYYVKKGHNLVELSENHFKNREYKKCLELLSQAFGMFEKGGAKEEAEKVKRKFQEIKSTYLK